MTRNYLFILFFISTTALFAQEEGEIETDRPSITETTSTVPKGKLQAEAGILHEKEDEDSHTLYIPTALWKYGLLENMELRLTTELVSEKTGETSITGLYPLTVGVKLNLWKEQGVLPETSVIAQTTLPKVASEEFQEEHLAPTFKLLFTNKITPNTDLGYNVVAEWDGNTGEPTYGYTFCPNFKLNNKLRTFVEAYGYMQQQQHPDHWIDAGLLFLVTKNIQIDIAGGYELTAHNNFHGYFETIGLSLRI